MTEDTCPAEQPATATVDNAGNQKSKYSKSLGLCCNCNRSSKLRWKDTINNTVKLWKRNLLVNPMTWRIHIWCGKHQHGCCLYMYNQRNYQTCWQEIYIYWLIHQNGYPDTGCTYTRMANIISSNRRSNCHWPSWPRNFNKWNCMYGKANVAIVTAMKFFYSLTPILRATHRLGQWILRFDIRLELVVNYCPILW